MSGDPVLVIQPRRLGDLILSIPLFSRLRALYPQNPLFVCAEPQFYSELAPLMPEARFLPPAELLRYGAPQFEAVINLSSREDISLFAGRARAALKLGPTLADGAMRINGFWQLYRAALTRNNAHNTMHWSDLDFLDLYERMPLPPAACPAPRPAGQGIVGLFVGASDAAKRPDALFWARLARRLSREGYKPLLLGGKAEIPLGEAIAAKCGPGHVNLCGKMSLGQLAATMKSLDICISPDTGPMHLANLMHVPTLNLSMGNVHAAETGPASPGQWILRANMSCAGCWQCVRPRLYCKAAFNPLGVFGVSHALLQGKKPTEIAAEAPSYLELLQTRRDEYGLAAIAPINAQDQAPSARLALDAFWRVAFIHFAWGGNAGKLAEASQNLRRHFPALVHSMTNHLGRMLSTFNQCLASRQSLPDDFWKGLPRHLRLFGGHTQMFLQNSDYSRQGWLAAMERAALLAQYLAQ